MRTAAQKNDYRLKGRIKMRKFNLKGTAAERMKGIPREEVKTGNESAMKTDNASLNPGFTEEQGILVCAWRTDVGKLRKNNQDAVILGSGLVGVADGMGGHRGGEVASAGLRDGLLREIRDCHPDKNRLEEAIRAVNSELWTQQENDASLSGMGTTLTVLWPAEKEMIIGQIGDSRAYLLRGGELTQITNDHSMVADMVRKGVLTEEQAACHPMRNYITRAVGTEESIETDLTIYDRKYADHWLICSDGLYGMVTKNQLQQMMLTEDLEKAADEMLQAALQGGGKDNITLVLLQDNTSFDTTEETNGDSQESTVSDQEKPEEVSDQ